MTTLNVSRCFPCRSCLLLNQNWCLLRCSWLKLSHLLDRPPGSGCSWVGAVIIVRARGEGDWVHSTRGSHSITLRSFFLLIFKDGGAELIISFPFPLSPNIMYFFERIGVRLENYLSFPVMWREQPESIIHLFSKPQTCTSVVRQRVSKYLNTGVSKV